MTIQICNFILKSFQMKKGYRLLIVISALFLFPWISLAGRWCCSRHGWQAYCGSNWMWQCRDWTQSPSCSCSAPQRKAIPKKATLTPDQKCNKTYPWTVYRASDWRCACPWNVRWSTRNKNTRSCPSRNW